MEKIKKKFPWISYGDLWTLGGVCAVQESGGPVVPWRPGRIDGFEHHVTPDGRLPDASKAEDHLRFIFYRMGWVYLSSNSFPVLMTVSTTKRLLRSVEPTPWVVATLVRLTFLPTDLDGTDLQTDLVSRDHGPSPLSLSPTR